MDHPPELQQDMAAVVAVAAASAASPVVHGQQPQSGPKRYRPAPAKTFQCRGYGECRMVFSRSEHLARHIRKHTGERPFTCHCGKQFSRLDNLRQHAQTVHADKQDQNERMMRDLTSLHASMAAANKIASARGGRRHNPVVKQEELSIPLHQRPGTSTGYEGDHDTFLYHQRNHSFRDPSQSFLGPPATSSSPAAGAAPGQSFLPFTFNLPDRDARPRTSVNGIADPNYRSLPPLASVVSATLSASSQQHLQPFSAPPPSSHGQPGGNSLLLPGSLTLRRPTTATRPGTAPASASLFSAKPSFSGGSGMGFSRPELSLQPLGRPPNLILGPFSCDPEPPSPSGNDASPFFFSPPSVDPALSSPPTVVNSRKRPFPGADGPFDDAPPASRDSAYEYGSESRPQSRRLSVMELCNDDAGILLSSTRSAESRPTTSGLVSSASALALVDRPSPTLTASPVYPRPPAQYSSAAAAATTRGNGSSGSLGQEEFSGTDRIFTAIRRHIPSPSSVLPYRPGQSGTNSAVSTFAYSPPFSSASPTTTTSYVSPRSSASPFSPRSPLSGPDAAANSLHRRTPLADDPGAQHDQIRFVRPSQHPSPALGLRV